MYDPASMSRLPTGWAALLAALLTMATPVRSADNPVADKIDVGIDDGERSYPVFVRMTDQLIGGRGEYERFCREHAGARRRELRPRIVAMLHSKADGSWKAVARPVDELEKAGGVRSVERFWIVNGVACEATGAACRRLAANDAVSFVYLQRGALRQQKRPPKPDTARAGATARYGAIYRSVLAGWEDDSDEPFTTRGFEISWNLRAIQADVAWREEKATGRGVVVAVMDTGLMVTPSLTRALWKNPAEDFNGRDDDSDGYVDDLFGYDFQADLFYCLGDDADRAHGSACAGIIAGRPDNRAKLITGVAPRARLMILRGMGFLKAYEYALEHGADVLSLSYMWVDVELGNFRGVYRTAHEHLAAAGIVAAGGAGNFSDRPRGRQIALPKDVPCVIAAAGLTRDGRLAPLSSQGPCTWTGVEFYDDYPTRRPLAKPDVTAFYSGYPVWGRPKAAAGRWTVHARESEEIGLLVGPGGNSFSGPHAAGVAALMLSANPDLCAWEVKELMEQTCKDLGPKGRDLTYGAGLLQAGHAVRAARRAAR
jgi:subtilisin family serine protease